MNDLSQTLLFVKRFRPSLTGAELMLLAHILVNTLKCNGVPSETRELLVNILFELQLISQNHGIPDLPDCFNIY